MNLTLAGHTLYRSTFDEKTGAIVRAVWEPRTRYGGFPYGVHDEIQKHYDRRSMGHTGFSPVPETVDVSITDKCHFGCTYCYMDSRSEREHAPKELVETILQGFDQPPYQIAIGGGEPTLHPELPYILKTARELGTVPNYTTAGDKLSERVVKATNEYCGGVAMTYHAFKGLDWFVEHYRKLRSKLTVQVNVHLIADKDVAKNLEALVNRREELGPINLVLLAYYPDVGRASLDSLLTKKVYMRDLPNAIWAAQGAQFHIAFSEGLLPYFLSRPELLVNTTFAVPSEGRFSCYFDPRGRISSSSFDPPGDRGPTAYETTSQKLWNNLFTFGGRPGGEACYDCRLESQCATPSEWHYLSCAYASHNKAF